MKTNIQLPKEYADIFNKPLNIIEGPNNALFLYTHEQFSAFLEKISENRNMNKDIDYSTFKRFKDRGIYTGIVSKEGILEIPMNLQPLLNGGNLEIKEGPYWIEIRYIHESSCHCDVFMCSKCVHGNCKDRNCNMHK